jgi:serine/threonine protein kinase
MAIGSHELEGQTLGQGRYWVTQKLGEGGMGTVFRAQDRNIESDVVIKMPRASMMEDPEFASRFTREIRALVKLSHPHIVKVSDVGTWDGIPYAVMQFLPGGTLEDRRPVGDDDQLYPCDPASVPPWLEPVAQALDYIHGQGYVHRDVKPGNILFDAEGHAFLSDFGVAKVLASTTDNRSSKTVMTGAGMVLGTPEYMAPELIMGDEFDGRADQYALAITVYELLCARRPFEHETKTKLLVLHTANAPPRLTEFCVELPEELSQAVLKGLSKDPKDRYPSCAALAAAVAATASGIPARAGRVRLKCPKCGKSGGMTATDYGKLRKSGGQPACSACKVPLNLVADGLDGAGPSVKTGDSGGYSLSGAPQPTGKGTAPVTPMGSRAPRPAQIEPTPTTSRPVPKTMIESSPKRPDERAGAAPRSRPQPTLIEQSPMASRPVAKTMIEKSPLRPEEPDGVAPSSRGPRQTAIERAPTRGRPAGQTMIEPSPLRSQNSDEFAPSAYQSDNEPAQQWAGFQLSGAPHSQFNQKAIAIAAVGGASLLVSIGIVISLFWSNKTTVASADTTLKAPVVAATVPANEPAPSSPLADPSRPEGVPAKTESLALARTKNARHAESLPPVTPVPDRAPTKAKSKAGARRKSAPVPRTDPGSPGPEKSQQPALAAVMPREAKPVRVAPTNRTMFNPENFKGKTEKKWPLTKILSTPKEYAERLVVPTGIFNLAPAPNDDLNGQRIYLVFQRQMRQEQNNSLGMSSAQAVELEVEPILAAKLDVLGSKKLAETVSILTLWFTAEGHPLIVQVDVLQKYEFGLKKATFYPEGDINYFIVRLSSVSEAQGKAEDGDWETKERMLHFARLYRYKVSLFKKMLQQGEQRQLNAVMGSLYQGMLKSAAANEAQQSTLRRGVGGKF